MFQLDTPWWNPVLRAAIIYIALLVLVRVSGRRTVGQFTPFDLLVVMLLSESVSGALNGRENSVTGGLLAAVTLIALNFAIASVTARSQPAQTLLDGRPILIGSEGDWDLDVMKAYRIPLADAEQALREADCDMTDMKAAILESDGKISILKDSSLHRSDRPRRRARASPQPRASSPQSPPPPAPG